jgi:subtilisin family serine protease
MIVLGPTRLAAFTIAVALACCGSSNVAAGQTIGAEVATVVQRDGSARVIVALRTARSRNAAARRRAVAGAQARVLARMSSAGDFQVTRRYGAVAALAGRVSAAGLAALRASPDVARVDLDVGGSGDLAISVPQIGADVLQDTYGLDGSGITVAVLDSGIDTDHPDLVSSIEGQQCFCSGGGGCCPDGNTTQSGPGAAEDDHGHGTHVSSIITSDGIVASRGVAPGAGIVAVKVLDANNEFCCVSDVVAGLDWVLTNRPDVDLVNMSLGTFATFPGNCDGATADTMALADAVDALTANGVAVFASSGNDSLVDQMEAPACTANTISVGAVNQFDQVRFSSNSDATLDLLAPGTNIVADNIGGGTIARSGTSMASPHVAGTAALLRQARPSLTPAELRSTMKSTGKPVLDGRNGIVFPRVDAEAAYLSLLTPLDDFSCYKVKDLKQPKFASTTVSLSDQFAATDGQFDVKKPFLVCNPASANGAAIRNSANQLVCYKVKGPQFDRHAHPQVAVDNVFGSQKLKVVKPFLLCVPSAQAIVP